MTKAKSRCPKCGKHISARAASCPACGAEIHRQVERKSSDRPKDTVAKKALTIKALIIGLLCAAVFGILGFGVENMSSGSLYSVINLLRLNDPTISLIAKALFWLSLPVVVVSFALLQQMED